MKSCLEFVWRIALSITENFNVIKVYTIWMWFVIMLSKILYSILLILN